VLCTDPYVTEDERLLSLEQVLAQADIVVIGAPHRVYRDLASRLPQGVECVDVWNLLGDGSCV